MPPDKETKTITYKRTIRYTITSKYKETIEYNKAIVKYRQIFSEFLDIILSISSTAHIIELIDILTKIKDKNYKNKMNNEEQTEYIIKPALEEFIVYAKNKVMGLQRVLDAFNVAKRFKAGFSGTYVAFNLNADEVLNKTITIPTGVEIYKDKRDINDSKKTARRNLIEVLAEKDKLVDEFIADLEILAGIKIITIKETETQTETKTNTQTNTQTNTETSLASSESDDDSARTFLKKVSERDPNAIQVQPLFTSSEPPRGGRNYKTSRRGKRMSRRLSRRRRH